MHDFSRSKQHIPRLVVTVFLLLIVTVGSVYGWYVYTHPCEISTVQDASALLITQMKIYDDVYVSAAAAPSRGSTIYPVSVMQKILADTQQIGVPACMHTAKTELIGYMGDAIRAFHAFEAQEGNDVVKSWLDSSYAHIRVFIQELDTIKACAPYCWP